MCIAYNILYYCEHKVVIIKLLLGIYIYIYKFWYILYKLT